MVIDYHGAEESELGILEVRTMRDSTMKGILHAAMSALAIVEAAESKHAARRAPHDRCRGFELHIAKIVSEYQTVSKSGAPGKSHIFQRGDEWLTN